MRAGRSNRRRRESARGAVLVHVAVALIGLLAFGALTIDYGVMWTSRRQAQNAADAAALAGALALTYDSGTDFDRARLVAKSVGDRNRIFGASPNISQGNGGGGAVTDDISFICPPGETGPCVRVNVYRNQGNVPARTGSPTPTDNPLPMFLGSVFNRNQQGVRATATAIVRAGNTTSCMRPFALMDKWDQSIGDPPWETQSGSAAPDPFGRDGNWDPDYWVPLPAQTGPDVMPEYDPSTALYVAPTQSSPGTGYRLFAPNSTSFCCDYGLRLHINICNPADTAHYGGCYQPLACQGPQCLETMTATCDGVMRTIGQSVNVSQEGLGARIPIADGIATLISQDPSAVWRPQGSTECPDGCVYSPATGLVNSSPRIVPVPVFDPMGFANATGLMQMPIRNFIGLFVEGVDPPAATAPPSRSSAGWFQRQVSSRRAEELTTPHRS